MKPVRVGRLPWREIEGRAVIIHPSQGVVHEANSVGAFLWSSADGTRNMDELASAVAENFEVDLETARGDAREFFAELESQNLIQWVAG